MGYFKFFLLALLAINPLALLTLFRSRTLFLQSISRTSKLFLQTYGRTLPAIKPADLLGVKQETARTPIVLRRGAGSLPVSTLVPILELLKLVNAQNVLEIGTQYGLTTWHLAANVEEGGKVYTVDLPPCDDQQLGGREQQPGTRVGRFFMNTHEANNIEQILCDSRELDEESFLNTMDLIFIDGNHTYTFAVSDTILAMKVVKNGGVVIWHDYHTLDPRIGVRDLLHQLRSVVPVYRLDDSICGVLFCTPAVKKKVIEMAQQLL